MKPSYSVSEAKEIFRFKNEETIRRYIRMGRRFDNNIDEIKSITDPKQEGYLALCTVDDTLPYRITGESILLVLQRKLNISLSEAENILKSFEDFRSSDESTNSFDSESTDISPLVTVGESASKVIGTITGASLFPASILAEIAGIAGKAAAEAAVKAGGTGEAATEAALAAIEAATTPKAKLYEQNENTGKADNDANSDDDEYFNNIFRKIFEINNQLRLHDEDIANIRSKLEKITEEKERFDEIYNREMELGKKMIKEREASKLAYHDELVRLHKGAEKRLRKEK